MVAGDGQAAVVMDSPQHQGVRFSCPVQDIRNIAWPCNQVWHGFCSITDSENDRVGELHPDNSR